MKVLQYPKPKFFWRTTLTELMGAG